MIRSGSYFLPTSILLALATTGCLALRCDFDLRQDKFGALTRIQIDGSIVAVMENGYFNNWKGAVKRGNHITPSDAFGEYEAEDLDKMAWDDKIDYEHPFLEELDGVTLSGIGADVSVQSATDYELETLNHDGTYTDEGNYGSFTHLPEPMLKEIERFNKAPFNVEVPGRSRFIENGLYAIMNADSGASGFSHIFFALPASRTSLVTVVNSSCNDMRVMPFKMLEDMLDEYS